MNCACARGFNGVTLRAGAITNGGAAGRRVRAADLHFPDAHGEKLLQGARRDVRAWCNRLCALFGKSGQNPSSGVELMFCR